MNPLPLESWVSWFKQEIVPVDLDDSLVFAFLYHLIDLGVLVPCENDTWFISGCQPGEVGEKQFAVFVLNCLNGLCQTEKGFAVGFFIQHKAEFYAPPKFPEKLKLDAGLGARPDLETSSPSKSSDFSNLQIVKKVGRQLSPFLEVEKNFISHLMGEHTDKENARKLYKYIFTKLGPKGAPLPWQQLSRRRHK